MDLDLLFSVALEYLELLVFLVHQLLPSDQEYLEYPANLLDLLAHWSLNPLDSLQALCSRTSSRTCTSVAPVTPVFPVAPVFPVLQSHLYFHSVHHLDLSHQSAPSDQEVLQMVQLFQLDLLFQSGLLSLTSSPVGSGCTCISTRSWCSLYPLCSLYSLWTSCTR